MTALLALSSFVVNLLVVGATGWHLEADDWRLVWQQLTSPFPRNAWPTTHGASVAGAAKKLGVDAVIVGRNHGTLGPVNIAPSASASQRSRNSRVTQ